MLRRTLTALAIAAVGLPAVIYGGVFYFLIMGAFLVGGAWEYVRLYRAVKLEPSEPVTVGGVLVILTARFFFADIAIPAFVALALLAMAVHLFAFERGRDHAAIDFGITVAGIVYLGWIGAYLLDLRNLISDEMGVWWFMLVLPLVWAADTGGYSIGAAYGKHKMAPRLSPRKSWEGYFAGIFTSVLIGAFFAYAFSSLGPRPLDGVINPMQGALLGLVIGTLAPLGDLGESMFKRQGGLKDSSNIFPGHGGFLDRIDSWIWGAAIGYFLIQYFIL
ncbi:MAG: phosphatidate cytidylyltransferase [Anaerolineales bacterium]|nr:phosphatidate cytidylyltransferase [Anaerolineales bacterium]NUQ83544.1 phosphatidate cytidylyltransferase [Anaerolineales bacterium]